MHKMGEAKRRVVHEAVHGTGELQRVINAYLKDGWTLVSSYPVSGAGYIGVSFVAVFTK